MPKLSTAAWILHDLGLATIVGGSIFAKTAFQPAARQLPDPAEHDRLLDDAWRRFQWVNVLAHAAVIGTWLPGRALLSGREAGKLPRGLTLAKDILVGATLATGVGSLILSRLLGRRVRRGEGPAVAASRGDEGARRTRTFEKVVGVLGTANLAAGAGVLGLTAALAMQSAESARFVPVSRQLP
jgi:uncharacterized membrane protein